MKQVKIPPTDKLIIEDFFSYLRSLGAHFRETLVWGDRNGTQSYDITSQSELHRHHIITEVCRKLDTMDIAYEVIE
jgi:hypothetical protein